MRIADQSGNTASGQPRNGAVAPDLAAFKLDELLGGLQDRLTEISHTGDRLQGLLDAVLTVGGGLQLEPTLHRIVRAAIDLVDARYGALGVLGGPDGGFADVVEEGIDPASRTTMGSLSARNGPLGTLIDDPRPLRLADISDHPAIAGQHHPSVRSLLAVPVRVRGEVFASLYLADKRGGGEFTADDEIVLRSLAAAAGVAVENARLFEQSLLRERWLEAVAAINAEMLAGASLHDTLRRIADCARELSGAAATMVLLGGDGSTLSLGASSGSLADHLEPGTRLPGDPVLAEVISTLETRQLGELGTVTTALPGSVVGTFGPAVLSPLRHAAAARGVLVAVRERGVSPFPVDRVPLLSSFAAQAMLALEFADKQDSERQLALLADRDRIGQDLHDHVIQRLFATGMGLQSVLRQVRDPHAHERIRGAIEHLDQTVREIRTSIFNLHSMDRGQLSLRRGLFDIVTELTADSEISPSVRISGAADTLVPDEIGRHVTAVVREGISNAVRHSRGSRVVLTVDVAKEVAIRIEDNGIGVTETAGRRSGLDNVRRRAVMCGGSVVVERREHGGTRLRWAAPLPGTG
jgi:signal transduction histidine kinase